MPELGQVPRTTDYTNSSQQRIIQVILALFSDVVVGVSPAALAKGLDLQASTITRDLDNLRTAGIAERDEETGLWRLTPRLPQQTIKVWQSIDTAQQRLEQAKQRFNRDPN